MGSGINSPPLWMADTKQILENGNNFDDKGMSWPEVAIVILNWNGKKYLEKFLPSVVNCSYPNKRVIVADNASSDDSISFLKEYFPGVELIENKENGGFARGYNLALAQVNSDYYVLLNSDVEVTPGWIEPVIHLMESGKSIGACQPKILSYSEPSKFEYAGASGGWIDNLGYAFARGRIFDVCETDHGQYDAAQPCFWASGAAFFIGAAVFHELDGLDEYFFAHQEEIDLCWRLQLAGYSVWVVPSSIVYHVGAGTLPKSDSKKTYLNFRNNLVMMAKNLPWQAALWKIPFRLFLDGLAAWQSLLPGRQNLFVPVAKAHIHFIGWKLFGKRNSWWPASRKGTIGGWYPGSIVWQHFVKKKMPFQKLLRTNSFYKT